MSSQVDCREITNAAWKRCLAKAELGDDSMNGDIEVIYRKNSAEALREQLQFANVKVDVPFRLQHCRIPEQGVHHAMLSKLFLDI